MRKPDDEIGEVWREYRQAQQERRAERLPERQAEIRALAEKGFRVQEMNGGYQFRIDGALDLYPIHRRFHHLKTGTRGGYQSLAAVVRRFLKREQVS